MNELLKALSLPKEELKKINEPIFLNLIDNNSYYGKLFSRYMKKLIDERKKYTNSYDFYYDTAVSFAEYYIPQILLEYGTYLDLNTSTLLLDIADGKRIKIFKPGEAIKKGLLNEGKYEAAFAKSDLGIIGFTPERTERKMSRKDSSDTDIIRVDAENALKMLSSMIHVTFHLIVNVMREEHLKYTQEDRTYSTTILSGFILNEGIVEQLSQNFASKYGFLFMPNLYYFQYVNLAEEIRRSMDDKTYTSMILSSDYETILKSLLTEEQFKMYVSSELTKYFEKKDIKHVTDTTIYPIESPTNKMVV